MKSRGKAIILKEVLKLLCLFTQEALTSIPEPDEPEEDEAMAPPPPPPDVKKSVAATNKAKVHYISLKPLTHKERKRQQKMAAEMAATEAELAKEEAEAAEDWTPPSPVALPDASTVKPILVQLGFQLSGGHEKNTQRQKKSKYTTIHM